MSRVLSGPFESGPCLKCGRTLRYLLALALAGGMGAMCSPSAGDCEHEFAEEPCADAQPEGEDE